MTKNCKKCKNKQTNFAVGKFCLSVKLFFINVVSAQLFVMQKTMLDTHDFHCFFVFKILKHEKKWETMKKGEKKWEKVTNNDKMIKIMLSTWTKAPDLRPPDLMGYLELLIHFREQLKPKTLSTSPPKNIVVFRLKSSILTVLPLVQLAL